MHEKVKSESEIIQSCLTLHNPMDCSPPGSSVHGLFQAGVLEWMPLPSPNPTCCPSAINSDIFTLENVLDFNLNYLITLFGIIPYYFMPQFPLLTFLLPHPLGVSHCHFCPLAIFPFSKSFMPQSYHSIQCSFPCNPIHSAQII